MRKIQENEVKNIAGLEFFSLLKTAHGDFLDFSVGFVKTFPKTKFVDFGLAGSGTLVEAAGVHAILTANHVIENLPKSGPLGLITPTRLSRSNHKLVVENTEFIERITIGRGVQEGQGPDLGLLILPSPVVSDLKVTKMFYNLSKRCAEMLNAPPPIDIGGWVLNGILDEQTEDLAPDKDYSQIKTFHGLTRPGIITQNRRTGEFDYFSFKPVYNDGEKPPKSFQGCSGGGLWHAIVEEQDGVLEITELLLAGVAFYQTPIADGHRVIECHGRQSIYEIVVKALEDVASRK